jgi:hypothetical protein
VKTSGKHLNDFKESVEYYSYWMQAVIYLKLVFERYRDLLDNDYNVEFRFIVIDRNHNIYPFPVSQKTLVQWFTRFKNESLFKANYHYTQKQFILPYEFQEELIVL